jgi:integrase
VLVWLAMTTGARRGELCGLRWPHFDQTRAVHAPQRSIAQDVSSTWEKHTKTHQRHHVTPRHPRRRNRRHPRRAPPKDHQIDIHGVVQQQGTTGTKSGILGIS